MYVCIYPLLNQALLLFPLSPQAKQFTIIHEVLGETKLKELSEQERRSLAFLKEATRKSSGGTPL